MNRKQNTLSLFTASFRQGFTSPNVPLVTVQQGDKELIFLLDSGSEHNVIDKSALKGIEHTVLKDDSMPNTLSGVGGVMEVGACTITFKCSDKEYTENFLVNDLSEALKMLKNTTGVIMHGIIGSQFMMKNKIVLDYQNLMAYSKKP